MSASLTWATTSGTPGSMRNADELSTTTAPAAANRGACSRDRLPPAENRATSMPAGSAVARSSIVTSPHVVSTTRPAERELAIRRNSSNGKAALFEDREHRGADGTCGADDGDLRSIKAHDAPFWAESPSPKPSWRLRTAAATSRPRTTQDMRIGEVEIISMLMAWSARMRNIRPAIPSSDFMPAPTSETLAMSGSTSTPRACDCRSNPLGDGSGDIRLRLGHREADVGGPVVWTRSERSCRR